LRLEVGSTVLTVFLRFGGLSGLGWLFDFCLLFLFVSLGHLPVFISNLMSATFAATLVFLLSRTFVFTSNKHFVLLRLIIYCTYTLAIIVVASIAMKYIAGIAETLAVHYYRSLTAATCAMIAKLLVTPVNFILNFVVARITNEYGGLVLEQNHE
jgi:putative flippase GtrA